MAAGHQEKPLRMSQLRRLPIFMQSAGLCNGLSPVFPFDLQWRRWTRGTQRGVGYSSRPNSLHGRSSRIASEFAAENGDIVVWLIGAGPVICRGQ